MSIRIRAITLVSGIFVATVVAIALFMQVASTR
jgi:hypothetical protein